METIKRIFAEYTSYFFLLLFCYASISKLAEFSIFQVQIGQSPLLSAYAGIISYGVIAVELVIVALLFSPKTRLVGLYASTALMSAFTIYIYLILNYSDFVPCSCGGILENLGWTEHLVFNIVCVAIGAWSVYLLERSGKAQIIGILTKLMVANLSACGIVVVLFISSEEIIKQDNNFTRRFLMHPTIENQVMTLDNPYYYFSGADEKSVYLGNRKFPQKIVSIDAALKSKKEINIELDITEFPYKKIETKVVAPYYYIFDGTVPIVKKGVLNNPDPATITLNDAYFSQFETVNNKNSYVLRTQSSKTKQLLIAQLKTHQGSAETILLPQFIEKQSDGVFDSDGVLKVDQSNGNIIYTYLYRNQFIVADSNFTVQRRLNTIDTVAVAQVKSVALPNGKYKMKKPPLKVNGFSAVHRNLLFNQSYLKGRYESDKRWKNSKVVDIYKTDSKLYVGSLYLENRGENQVTDMIVTDNFLYAIAGNQLIQYKLTKPLLKYYKKGEAENLYKE